MKIPGASLPQSIVAWMRAGAKETPGDDDIERVLARLPARAESAEHVCAESD